MARRTSQPSQTAGLPAAAAVAAELVGQAAAGEAVGEGALVNVSSRRLVSGVAGPGGARLAVLYRSDFKRLQEKAANDVRGRKV